MPQSERKAFALINLNFTELKCIFEYDKLLKGVDLVSKNV